MKMGTRCQEKTATTGRVMDNIIRSYHHCRLERSKHQLDAGYVDPRLDPHSSHQWQHWEGWNPPQAPHYPDEWTSR